MSGVDLMRTGDFMRFVISRAIFLLALMPAMAQEKAGLLLTAATPQAEVAATAIPDAPVPSSVNEGGQSVAPSTSSSSSASTDAGQQTKRILWICQTFARSAQGSSYLRNR